MKRFAMFLGGLLILPAFGEVAPVFYDEYDIEYADYADQEYLDADDELLYEEDEATEKSAKTPVKVSRQQTVSRNIANRSTASRTVPSSQTSAASGRGKSSGNSARAVAARTTTNASPRANASRTVTSRTAATNATRAAATRATGGTRTGVTARTGKVATTAVKASGTSAARNATTGTRVSRAARTTGKVMAISGNGVGTGGDTLYNSNGTSSLYNSTSARLGVRSSSSLRRSPVVSVTSNGLTTTEEAVVAADTSEMDELAELTDYCKSQYMACMDNYCNVLDENQGRCSCSVNLKNYAKSEAALKQATEELQEVAQKIQYIGLSAREVETLFTQTEAERTMQTKTDTTQLKTSLDKVKDMIIEARSGNASSTSSGMSFDLSGLLDFTIDSTGFDLSSFLGGFGSSNGNVSNQRGEELFKTATNRCKANVLRACTAQGVDASTITNAYDLEIDKECIAYEKSLNESNNEMTATVRNAKNVLQKARLMVAQSKNEYDMRGCINALDSCMQDEFVCGSDYENCLDPSGRYIVNGAIVVGSQPGHAIDPSLPEVVGSVLTSDVCDINLYRTWDFSTGSCNGYGLTHTSPTDMNQNNAWGAGTNDTLANYINETVTNELPTDTSVNMSKYLQNKIGYAKKDSQLGTVNYGMCIGVLNKCQDYTYTGKGTSAEYNPNNDVIKQYLGRVLIQIKAKQDEILSEYAESCITDVQSCLSQNGYPTEEPSEWGTDNAQIQANIAINACRASIVTCMSVNGYSVGTPTPDEMNCWVMGLQFNTVTQECEQYQNVGAGGSNGGGNGGGGNGGEYTVKFSCTSSGTGSPEPKTTVNGTVNLHSNTSVCKRNGYELRGWVCEGQWYSPGAPYSPSANNLTCTADYPSGNNTSYTITMACDTSCTGNKPSNITGITSGQNQTLSGCAGSGQSVSAWSCTAGGSVNGNTVTVTGNTTCTATCSGSTPPSSDYTITYNCGTGGSFANAGGKVTQTGSGQVNLKPSTICNAPGANYTFDYWKCGNSSTHYASGGSYNLSADVTCTAQWKTSTPTPTCSDYNNDPTACGNTTGCQYCTTNNQCIVSSATCTTGGFSNYNGELGLTD